MRKQFAVLGLGSFGRSVALTLENMGCDVIVVRQIRPSYSVKRTNARRYIFQPSSPVHAIRQIPTKCIAPYMMT